jgi:hypothetical protein
MSAFTLDTVHVDALLTAGLAFCTEKSPLTWHYPPPTPADPSTVERQCTLTPVSAGRVGAMLLTENARCVNYRYDQDNWEPPYLFHRLPGTPDPLVVLKAIACLEYQSCEHPGWLASEARVFCQALRRVTIPELPGYHDAQGWPIQHQAIFQTKPATSTRDRGRPVAEHHDPHTGLAS